jgi:hypothetical protein
MFKTNPREEIGYYEKLSGGFTLYQFTNLKYLTSTSPVTLSILNVYQYSIIIAVSGLLL